MELTQVKLLRVHSALTENWFDETFCLQRALHCKNLQPYSGIAVKKKNNDKTAVTFHLESMFQAANLYPRFRPVKAVFSMTAVREGYKNKVQE